MSSYRSHNIRGIFRITSINSVLVLTSLDGLEVPAVSYVGPYPPYGGIPG